MEPNEPIEDHPNNLIPVNGALLMDVAADAVIAAWSFIELFCLFYGFLIYQDNYAMILADQVLEFFLRDRAVVTLQAKIRQIRIRADAANVRPPWEVMRRIFTLVPPPPEGNGNLGFPFPPFQPLDGVIQDAADGNMIQGENFAAAAGNMVEGENAAAAAGNQDAAAAAGNNQDDAHAVEDDHYIANEFLGISSSSSDD